MLDKDFLKRVTGDLPSVVNKNPADYSEFHRQREEQMKRLEEHTKSTRRQELLQALQAWDMKTPPRWKGASLSQHDKTLALKIRGSLKKNPNGGFFLSGPGGSGKTHLAYAISRRLVGSGQARPDKILVVDESEIRTYASGGFKGRDEMNALLKKSPQVIVLDSIRDSHRYTEREQGMIEEIIEKAYGDSSILIICSAEEPARWVSGLSETAEGRVKAMIANRRISLNPRESDDSWGASSRETSNEEDHIPWNSGD